MQKPRAKHLTGKEEVKRAAEVQRKQKLVVDRFYPALTSATVSVDEARMLIRAISSLMMEETLQAMRDTQFGSISEKLHKKLTEDGQRVEEVRSLLAVFEKETLFSTRELIEGMLQAIEQMIIEDMQARTLNSFEPNWDKMLQK